MGGSTVIRFLRSFRQARACSSSCPETGLLEPNFIFMFVGGVGYERRGLGRVFKDLERFGRFLFFWRNFEDLVGGVLMLEWMDSEF